MIGGRGVPPPSLTVQEPGPAPARPWRLSARLLLVGADARVLLVPVHDDEAGWWDLLGGGVEARETTAEAAVRETLEETGYAVPLEAVGPVCWSGEVLFRWLGRWHWSRQVVHLARTANIDVPVQVRLTDEESGTHGAARWWTVAQAVERGLAVPPFDSAAALGELIAGSVVTDAFVRWLPPASP